MSLKVVFREEEEELIIGLTSCFGLITGALFECNSRSEDRVKTFVIGM